MATLLPTVPYVVFCVLEPISLVAGFVAAWFNTTAFITDQYPHSGLQAMLPASTASRILAMQLGNLYGLMCILGLMLLNTTTDRKIVRGYLMCLAVADIGHVSPTLYYLGYDRVVDVAGWNHMAWGNIGATLVLFVLRLLTLSGVFGEIKHVNVKGKKA